MSAKTAENLRRAEFRRAAAALAVEAASVAVESAPTWFRLCGKDTGLREHHKACLLRQQAAILAVCAARISHEDSERLIAAKEFEHRIARGATESTVLTAYHGLQAYIGKSASASEIYRKAHKALGVEVCCADRPIGAVGVVMVGDCRAVFERDCMSKVADDGNRIADGYTDWSMMDQQGFETASAGKSGRDYLEAWVVPSRITHVWVKPHASAAEVLAAEMLARHFGVELIDVDGSVRIGDLLDSVPMSLEF